MQTDVTNKLWIRFFAKITSDIIRHDQSDIWKMYKIKFEEIDMDTNFFSWMKPMFTVFKFKQLDSWTCMRCLTSSQLKSKFKTLYSKVKSFLSWIITESCCLKVYHIKSLCESLCCNLSFDDSSVNTINVELTRSYNFEKDCKGKASFFFCCRMYSIFQPGASS